MDPLSLTAEIITLRAAIQASIKSTRQFINSERIPAQALALLNILTDYAMALDALSTFDLIQICQDSTPEFVQGMYRSELSPKCSQLKRFRRSPSRL
jgi:hypothetical protein